MANLKMISLINKFKMKKKIIYIAAGILVLIISTYLLFLRGSSEEIKYRTEKITRGDIAVIVKATGTVNPVKTVQVGSQVSGIISKLYVDFNSQVKEGQIIAQIDSTFLAASVKEAEANYERALAQANEARRNLKRTEELYKKNLVSQAEMDAAQTSYETTLAQLKQAQAALDRAKVNLRYSIIRSPIDGVVVSRDVDVGQTVAASLQAPKLFVIANDLKKMQVEANVDEADIGNVKIGQDVNFTVDAYPNQEFYGKVTQIRLSPQMVQNVVTYTVIIEVPNPEMKLMPGMTATVSILVDRKENVMKVPALALRFQPPAGVLEKIESEKELKSSEDLKKNEASENLSNEEQKRRNINQSDTVINRLQGASSKRNFGSNIPQGQRVWVKDQKGNLKQIILKTGITDNRYVEVIDGNLNEGDDVVIGTEMTTQATSMQSQRNPFVPQQPSGGRRMGL